MKINKNLHFFIKKRSNSYGNKTYPTRQLFSVIFVTVFNFLYAQSISREVISSGSVVLISSSTHNYIDSTIGESVILTIQNNNFQITQGFEQPDEFIEGREQVKKNKKKNISLELYPNPTDKFINIHIETQEITAGKIRLININGEVVISTIVRNGVDNITIDVGTLKKGLYFIQFIVDDKIVSSKKIIKK